MTTARRLPSMLPLAAAVPLLLGALLISSARAADPAPENPFLELMAELRIGDVVRTRGVILAALEVPPSRQL